MTLIFLRTPSLRKSTHRGCLLSPFQTYRHADHCRPEPRRLAGNLRISQAVAGGSVGLVHTGAMAIDVTESTIWLLILAGLIAVVTSRLHKGSRPHTPGQRPSRPSHPPHHRSRPRPEPDDPEDLDDDWDDDEWDRDDDSEWDWDDIEPPHRGSRSRRRRSESWETDDSDYI